MTWTWSTKSCENAFILGSKVKVTRHKNIASEGHGDLLVSVVVSIPEVHFLK